MTDSRLLDVPQHDLLETLKPLRLAFDSVEILKRPALGCGGFGDVYLGELASAGEVARKVAVKMIRPQAHGADVTHTAFVSCSLMITCPSDVLSPRRPLRES